MNTKLMLVPTVLLFASQFTQACPCEDKQVIEIVRVTNQIQIDEASAALPRLTKDTVIAYAKQMIAEHTASNVKLAKLSDDTGLLPVATDMSHYWLLSLAPQLQQPSPTF